jgi:glycosyltransferase involved in cell wall biosynthesis
VFCNWHNIESELMERYADRAPLPRRLYARATSRKLQRFEDFLLADLDGHVVCSERERQLLLERHPAARVATVPNGVDLEAYRTMPVVAGSGRRLVFVGSMDYHANIDGIVSFVREEWPAIRKSNARLTLSVVGSSPSPEVQELANEPGVEITGTVPDVRPYYEDAVAAIIPLRVGGGTRLKILEAMAAGVPVVSTAVGREGLGAELYDHLLPADEPGDWLKALSRLSDMEYRSALVGRARDFVRTRYDWSILGERLVATYEGWMG